MTDDKTYYANIDKLGEEIESQQRGKSMTDDNHPTIHKINYDAEQIRKAKMTDDNEIKAAAAIVANLPAECFTPNAVRLPEFEVTPCVCGFNDGTSWIVKQRDRNALYIHCDGCGLAGHWEFLASQLVEIRLGRKALEIFGEDDTENKMRQAAADSTMEKIR